MDNVSNINIASRTSSAILAAGSLAVVITSGINCAAYARGTKSSGNTSTTGIGTGLSMAMLILNIIMVVIAFFVFLYSGYRFFTTVSERQAHIDYAKYKVHHATRHKGSSSPEVGSASKAEGRHAH